MSVLSKLAFWKKDDDFGDLGPLPGEPSTLPGEPMGDELGLPPLGEPSPSENQPRAMPTLQPSAPSPLTPMQHQNAQPAYGNQEVVSKDMEVIIAKLDSIRATLESLNQRIANIERIAYREDKPDIRRQW